MKRTSIITASLVTGMLALGLATQSSAMVGGNYELHNGNTPSRMVTGVDHYRFQVEAPGQLQVSGRQWSPEGVQGRLQAELQDADGRVVARSSARGNDFVLQENLAPGRYTLRVQSSPLAGRNRATQRYYLTTDLR